MIRKFDNIENNILQNKLGLAFNDLHSLAYKYDLPETISLLDEQKEIYKFLLDFFAQDKPDPSREDIHREIARKLLAVNDHIKKISLKDTQPYIFYFSEFLAPELETYLNQQLDEDTLDQYFLRIWFSDTLSKVEEEKLYKLLSSDAPLHLRSTLVTALNFSLWLAFDEAKFRILISLVENQEMQIWERALVGLLIGIYFYDNRMSFYPSLIKRFEALKELDNIDDKIKAVIFQFIKSKETSELTRKIEDEILPELQKMAPDIEEKLDIDKILSENMFEDENPDWEKLFDTSDEVFGKMAELSMLQMDGSDILHSTFSKLKDFQFFEQISNWFKPFYSGNTEVINYLEGLGLSDEDIRTLDEALEDTPYMCNSDKYSFCFQFSMIPVFQRSSIIKLFKAEADMSKEVKDDETLTDSLGYSRVIITQYIQDLYRFFKVYPFSDGLDDIFEHKLDFYNTKTLYRVVESKSLDRETAELYFSKKFYSEAIDVFEKISKEFNEAQIYEKIGFAYQKMKDYKSALDYYKKAELFDAEKKWLVRKLAFCYMKTGQYGNALEYYLRLYNDNPDDLKVNINIGNCYLRLEDYEEALKYYRKVEYYNPNNIKVLRPMAWAMMNLHKEQEALKLYLKLIEIEKKNYDLVTLGHLYWLNDRKADALELYKEAYALYGAAEDFVKDFMVDKVIMNSYGISDFDLNLMLDAIIL